MPTMVINPGAKLAGAFMKAAALVGLAPAGPTTHPIRRLQSRPRYGGSGCPVLTGARLERTRKSCEQGRHTR